MVWWCARRQLATELVPVSGQGAARVRQGAAALSLPRALGTAQPTHSGGGFHGPGLVSGAGERDKTLLLKAWEP